MNASSRPVYGHAPRGGVFLLAALLVAIGPAPLAAAADPFTVVVLPDTQYYTQTEARNTAYFKAQTAWIAANRAAKSIAFVLHLGDIQNDGNPFYARTDDIYQPDLRRPTGLVPDDAQFRRASEAIGILDAAGVPYSLLPGNHDFIDHNVKDEPIYYLKWFGPQRYAGMPTYGGSSPATPTTPWAGLNTWHTFEAGGYRFLNIAMQFAPDERDLAWAQSVINANPGLPTILTTHALLNTTGYQTAYRPINDLFVRNNPQVVMTLNGHINGAFRQTVTNIAGRPVQQMLVDYQFEEFPGYFDGAGYLRTMEFDVDAGIVRVETYSPVTRSHLTDAANSFTLPLDLASQFGRQSEPGLRGSVSFQQGLAGYAGTVDTYVSAAAPSTSYASAVGLWVDRDADTPGLVQPRQALLRFEDLFGAAAIPANAIIDSATLTLRTSTTPNSHSSATVGLYRLLTPWSESSTWNSLGSGVAADGREAILAANASFAPVTNGGLLSFDVTESLFAWSSGAPNHGWLFQTEGTDGWRFDSAEAAVAANRPSLSVSYTLRDVFGDVVMDVPGASRTQAQAGYATIRSAASVTKGGPGRLVMDAANAYAGPTTISAGTLEATHAQALASTQVTVGRGATLAIAPGITLQSPAVTLSGGTLSGATLAVHGSSGIASLAIAAGTVAGNPLVAIGPGGTLSLAPGSRLVVGVGRLEVDESAAGGRLDLGAGEVTVAAGGITAAALRADIIAGRNGGSWTGGSGILSSTAAASGGTRTVGYVVAADGTARVSYAAAGDADLDGRVNIFDLVIVNGLGGYGTGRASEWSEGDFNYDGAANVFDLVLTNGAGVYGAGMYLPDPTAAMTITPVPEPGPVVMLAACLALACHQRSRGRRSMHTAMTRIPEPRRAGSGTAQAPRSAWVTNRSFTILDPALTMNSDTPKAKAGASGSMP